MMEKATMMMPKCIKRAVSGILMLAMLFGCMATGVPVDAAIKLETKDGILDVELENLSFNSEKMKTISDAMYSGGKAVGINKEDKTLPQKSDPAHLDLSFQADRDGVYAIWLRHTSSVSKQDGQSIFVSLNNEDYAIVKLSAEPKAPEWHKLVSIEVQAGKKASVRIIGRQNSGIGLDRAVITSNANYEPSDALLGIKASVTALTPTTKNSQSQVPAASTAPGAAPTPGPLVQLKEDGTYDLIDFNKEDKIKAVKWEAVKDNTTDTQFTAKWSVDAQGDIHLSTGITGISNLSQFNELHFRAYGNKQKPVRFLVRFLSNDPATAGEDYYSYTCSVYKDGWNEYSIPLADFALNRSPLGWDRISQISLFTKGWDLEPTPGAVLYLDKLQLAYSKELAAEQAPATSANDQDFSKIEKAICLYLGSPNALANMNRVPIDGDNANVAPFVQNGRTLVPVRFIAEQLGAQVSFEANTSTVTIQKDATTIQMVIGTNQLIKNGVATALDVPANTYYDRTFVPLRVCAEAFDKKVFWDDMGLIIISDAADLYNNQTDHKLIRNIIRNVIYDRPTGMQMLEDLKAKHPNDAHPRLLATSADFDKLRQNAQTDATLASWVKRLQEDGAGILTQPVSKYDLSAGDMLEISRTAKEKLFRSALLYQLTRDVRYAQRAWQEIEAVGAFPNWNPAHFLDVGEMAFGVSLAYDWCYDALTSEQRAYTEQKLKEHSIDQGLKAYHDKAGWTMAQMNWNAVCNAGLTMSSIALANIYPKECEELLGYTISSIELGVNDYAPDGGYSEGPAYWAYGTNYLMWMIASLDSAMGTNYGIFQSPGLSRTGYYPVYIESAGGAFNYHDSAPDTLTDTSSLFWFASKLGDTALAGLRYGSILKGTQTISPKDILWYRPGNLNPVVNMPMDIKFSKIHTATMRSSWTDDNGIFAALHAGDNSVNHGNLDTGTYVLDGGGLRWFVDLGGDNYKLPNYFSNGTGGTRWNYYRMRGEGQNTVIIDPDMAEDQVVKSLSPMTAFLSKPKGAYAIADTAPAHGRAKVKSAQRGLLFTHNRKTAVIQDEITMQKPAEFWWFAHTRAEIVLGADGRSAVLSQQGKRLYVAIVSPNQEAKFEVMEAVPLPDSPKKNNLEGSNAGIKKLAINLQNAEQVNLAVVCSLLDDGQDKPVAEYSYTKMDQWNISDGDLVLPKLSEITIGGKLIEGFDPLINEYHAVLPYGTTEIPELIAATSGQYIVDFRKPSALPGVATIKLTDPTDSMLYNIYTISLRAVQDIEITTSHSQQGNPPENSMDGDPATRWAADGSAWIQYTFQTQRELASVWLSFWKASPTRKTILEIQISEDGEQFKTIFKGQSTGETEAPEEFKLPAPAKVKAVKIIGSGNTANQWNSLLEIAFR